jgi:tRNA A-37 threonylcarbamoyl transferase component Bud32
VSAFEGTPRFEIVRRLGMGGMGAVFEAVDRERERTVALKVLTVENPDALVRFKREFRALQSVHHPNLVALGELFAQGDNWFFTMELVCGVDLLSHIRAEPGVSDGRATLPGHAARAVETAAPAVAFDEARLRAAFHQLGLGLAALHRHGHIHRDIKPSNVLVAGDNRVVILDFGLVRAAGDSVDSSPDVVVGTPEYMAPEQAMGRALSPATDWYAVGALLYEALVGEPPFSGAPVSVMVQKQMQDPPSPASLVRNMPADLDALCMALLRRDPAARPAEAEILQRLYVELRRDDRTYLTLPTHPTAERFVGRSLALDALGSALGDALAGTVRLCFVTGAWGIGKTALMRELARQLAVDARAPLVWSSRCHEREAIPWKAVDMLIDDASRFLARCPPELTLSLLPDDAELMARTFPVLTRVPAIAALPPGAYDELEPHERRERLFRAVRELLRRTAAVRPLVLIVEDLQWADADGLALLRAILAPPSDVRLLFIGTMRADDPYLYAPAGLVEGLPPSSISSLHLDALSAAESNDLAEALWPEADEATLRRVAHQAAGHPLFLRELCLGRGAHTVKLGDVLRARIAPLPASARGLLDVLAVAESALPQALVAELAGVDWAEAEAAIAHLRAAQLARTVGLRRTDLVEIAHDRVRNAVRDPMLPATSRLLHERIAHALEALPRASVEVLSEHWLGAGQRARALACVTAGAERAVELLAFERAVALFERALELCDAAERPAVEARAQSVRLAAQRAGRS